MIYLQILSLYQRKIQHNNGNDDKNDTKSVLVSCTDIKTKNTPFTAYFFVQGAFTNRWKKFHFYNYSPVFEVMHNMTLPFMKKKIRDRVRSQTYYVLFYVYIFGSCVRVRAIVVAIKGSPARK